jgi:hypothetical protein
MKMTEIEPLFISAVLNSINKNGFAVVYIYYKGGAGAEDYFLVNSNAELEEVFAKVKPYDHVNVLIEESSIAGKADYVLQEQACVLLSNLQKLDSDECIIAVKSNTGHLSLIYGEDWQSLYSAAEIETWFAANHDAPVILFGDPWSNDKVLTLNTRGEKDKVLMSDAGRRKGINKMLKKFLSFIKKPRG